MYTIRKIVLLALASFFVSSSASAATYVIQDGYVGGNPTDPAEFGHDVIGAPGRYSVDRMEVTTDASGLTVSIFSNFFDNVGYLGIQLGDLFVSTNGWNPFGPAPYNNDNKNNGEQWEYALVLDNHGAGAPVTGQNMLGTNGTIGVYAVNPANIVSSFLVGGSSFRADQEVQYNPGNDRPVALGTWSIIDAPGEMDELRFNLSLAALAQGNLPFLSSALGFHWTQTCGNDVIEGSTPEPSTMLLFGAAALGVVRRKRKLA